MTRNLDRRIEVTCPIYDKDIKDELRDMINFQLRDNIKGRIINTAQDNPYVRSDSQPPLQSQVELYNYYHDKLKS
jgi:polyphosphate kinase